MISTRSDSHFRFLPKMPEVFEEGRQSEGVTQRDDSIAKNLPMSPDNLYSPYTAQSHQHNGSTSTSASESTGSSPTTTLSLADDSSVTEMSPGSSPESPMAKTSVRRPQTADDINKTPQQSSSSFFELNTRTLTPGKRARNLKNLAVNTTGNLGSPRGAATALPMAIEKSESAPELAPMRTANPSFKRPPSPPKRRPSNLSLTIVTPAKNGVSLASGANVVPPTPSLIRPNTLRHFQSSPSLPIAVRSQSPANTLAPVSSNLKPSLNRATSDGPLKTEEEINFDLPQSREEKPEAYPDGPICVVDPYVDLYLEPTAEEASRYDVVLNVASEVRNPFMIYTTPDPTREGIRLDGGGGIQIAPIRTSSSSSGNLDSNHSEGSSTPTTPKATPDRLAFAVKAPSNEQKPEYIHIPWEHNTDIVADLLRLVKMIDGKVKAGKRVLIHCQCGVSRSATLVVAYCMYIHPEYSVQQAYDTVKQRSKWIGPNMNLIMQLQEFSSLLSGSARRTGVHSGLRSLTPIEASTSWNEWRRTAGTGSPIDSQGPKTAPLLDPNRSAYGRSGINGSEASVSPGPSSAPSCISWPIRDDMPMPPVMDRGDGRALSVPGVESLSSDETDAIALARTSSEKQRPQSMLFEPHTMSAIQEPAISTIPEATSPPSDSDASPISPRSAEFAMSALQPSAETSPEDRFGLMSPTTSSFSHSPLDRDALLGSLGMGSTIPADQSRRRTQNFSIPFRKAQGPSHVVQVATGVIPGMQKPPLVRQTQVQAPSRDVESLLDPLLSPRASAFTLNPFSSVGTEQQGDPAAQRAAEDDPRSPAQQGINPIVRNIADAL